ncbi:hypothetical protein [Streptomyces longhuiensis]|uniref:hypothetical protein n=1 Tax=Streptomyces longhuiensis TaxID=2880933 RepID=UPI001D0AFD86|nr:hypothetical protein [Streptomyces longhuiensis]UDM05499.1 hypothetical protein LGI35_45430 [Streptomyces longhuiensis]
MIIILGIILLILAAIVAAAGIFSNTGSGHALTNTFALFGHDMTGSTGTLFLYGIIVGAVAMLGLGLLLTGTRRTSRLAAEARHGLRESNRENAALRKDRGTMNDHRGSARGVSAAAGKDRDDLAEQRDDPISRRERDRQDRGRAQSPGARDEEAPGAEGERAPGDGHHRWPHLLGHRAAHR